MRGSDFDTWNLVRFFFSLRGCRRRRAKLVELHVDWVVVGFNDVLQGSKGAEPGHEEAENDEKHVEWNAPFTAAHVVLRVSEGVIYGYYAI